MGKPYKVWNGTRTTKKALVAASLSDLIEKGKKTLKINGSVTAVLESDGTIVEDEDYFSFVKENTIFLLLQPDEKYRPSWEQQGTHDEPDAAIPAECRALSDVAKLLRKDIGNLVTLSPEDLEVLVGAPKESLRALTSFEDGVVDRIQRQCQRYLDERQETREAMELLKLMKQAEAYKPTKRGESSERMKERDLSERMKERDLSERMKQKGGFGGMRERESSNFPMDKTELPKDTSPESTTETIKTA